MFTNKLNWIVSFIIVKTMDLFRWRRYTSRKSITSGASGGLNGRARAESSDPSQLQSRVESRPSHLPRPTWTGAGQKQQERTRTKVVVGANQVLEITFKPFLSFGFSNSQIVERNLATLDATTIFSQRALLENWRGLPFFFLLPRGF